MTLVWSLFPSFTNLFTLFRSFFINIFFFSSEVKFYSLIKQRRVHASLTGRKVIWGPCMKLQSVGKGLSSQQSSAAVVLSLQVSDPGPRVPAHGLAAAHLELRVRRSFLHSVLRPKVSAPLFLYLELWSDALLGCKISVSGPYEQVKLDGT